MTLEEYNTFCAALPHVSHVVQWGGAHVWKVAGKVFAIGWDRPGEGLFVTFKVGADSYELLRELPGCRPAPYLASRGMSWIQRTADESMDDAALTDYLVNSHRLVAAGLPRRVRAELGLDAPGVARAPSCGSRMHAKRPKR